MREILVIGIGAGNPDHLTLEAAKAIGLLDVVFVIDKGTAPALVDLRAAILRAHARPEVQVVTIADAARDRAPADYEGAVADWHQARAERIGAAVATELGEEQVGGFLVWGDPSLYDSTLRVLDRVLDAGAVSFTYRVLPGVSSLHTLAAAHGVPLHAVGEPVLVTTGRRLASDFGAGATDAVVFLDGQLAFTEIDPAGVEILWGAYLGTADQLLVRGALTDVADEIVSVRTAARARHGWIMDVYLLRRQTA